MIEIVDSPGADSKVAPLRKQKPDGTKYRRPAEVRDTLAILLDLQPLEVAARARVADPESPDYVPSECVLYFVRRLDAEKHAGALRDLFEALRKRVLRAVPAPDRPAAGLNRHGQSAVELEIRE